MKTFEEKLAAWMDGRLAGPELAAFEAELETSPKARDYAASHHDPGADDALGSLLRSSLQPRPLTNGDFFNHQLMGEIEAASPSPVDSPARRRVSFWSLPRMAFSGAFLILLSTVLFFATVPKTRREVKRNAQYVQNILNARSDDPAITATSFHSSENNVNVVWLDGLGYLPRDHKLK